MSRSRRCSNISMRRSRSMSKSMSSKRSRRSKRNRRSRIGGWAGGGGAGRREGGVWRSRRRNMRS